MTHPKTESPQPESGPDRNLQTPLTLDAYKTYAGKTVGVSDWFLIDQRRVDAFAGVTCDHQFIHVDPERAKRGSPFGQTVAHGFLTLSLLTHFFGQSVPELAGVKTTLNYGLNRVRFISPVFVGARIRARFELLTLDDTRHPEITTAWQATVETESETETGTETPARTEQKPALVAHWITRHYL